MHTANTYQLLIGEQEDGISTAVFPLTPYLKSDHLYTSPIPKEQDLEKAMIAFFDKT